MLLGIYCAYRLDGLFTYTVAAYTFGLLLSLFVIGCLWYSRLSMHRFGAERTLLVYSLYFYGGVWICLFQKSTYTPVQSKDTMQSGVYVRLIDEPQYKARFIRCKALLINSGAQVFPAKTEKIMLTVFRKPGAQLRLSYGDELAIRARLKKINPPKNTGQFDVQYWMATQHIYRQASIGEKNFVRVATHKGNPIIDYALRLRKKQVDKLTTLIKDKEAAAVAVTLILGYRSDLSATTISSYARTGTIHALSVSGMHVGLIYLLLDKMLIVMNYRKWAKRLKLVVIVLLIWAYALLTGFSPAVLRSAIMITVMITATASRRITSGLNILAFSACVLLVTDTFLMFDVGFQLSYLSVFGLLTIQPVIRKWFTFKNYLMRTIWDAIALSLAAQLFTFPLALYYFHQFPVYFLFSNLLIAIPVTLMMYLGILVIALRLEFLAPLLEGLIVLTNRMLLWMSTLPLASIGNVSMTVFELCSLYIAIILLTVAFFNYKTKLLLTGLAFLLILSSSRLIRTLETRKKPYVLRNVKAIKDF
ncbi:competence protein ComEC [Pedobacter duraquae]|uniref:Competence protein ComEC n=2 Tax=Pedobacter duraquae TaxID=425511 RepID=A0A4R6IGU1_9SPHI|nr:competence protein ComEC [Pedobacter duraquae]